MGIAHRMRRAAGDGVDHEGRVQDGRVRLSLDQKENRALYHRIEKDVDNHFRIFVHFRWKGPARRR